MNHSFDISTILATRPVLQLPPPFSASQGYHGSHASPLSDLTSDSLHQASFIERHAGNACVRLAQRYHLHSTLLYLPYPKLLIFPSAPPVHQHHHLPSQSIDLVAIEKERDTTCIVSSLLCAYHHDPCPRSREPLGRPSDTRT